MRQSQSQKFNNLERVQVMRKSYMAAANITRCQNNIAKRGPMKLMPINSETNTLVGNNGVYSSDGVFQWKFLDYHFTYYAIIQLIFVYCFHKF